jgi:hypothetical protein
MTRAITTGGWTLLLLSILHGPAMYAQAGNPRFRGLANQQGQPPAAAAQPAASPQTQSAVPAPQEAPQAAPAVAPSMLQQPAQEAHIDFRNDVLTIRANNSSLAAILRQVAIRSGMKVEGLGGDERVFGSFGPGPPRDVLADLLDGTAYNLVLLGDLNNGAPRELILTPTTRGGSVPQSPAPQANPDEPSNDQESADVPPPPPQPEAPPPGTTPPPTPGVRTPQQLFEQLQRMRTGQQQGQQPPVQQDSPQQ